jgi:hypothetical protein
MFLICPIKEKTCAFCGTSNDILYCGIAKNDNRIDQMKKCPYKPRKRRR